MDKYRITEAKSNICLIIDYMIESFFNRNSKRAKDNITEQLKKRLKGRAHSLSKSYLFSGETMFSLVSGIKNSGKILYSNNVFKEHLGIKEERFSRHC